MSDPFEDPDFIAFAEHAMSDLVPKLEQSAVTISLMPRGATDVKYALELGFSIMLDKPIILAVHPGTRVPSRLAKVADEIIEADITTDEGREKFQARLFEILPRYGIEPHEDDSEDHA